jgi:hypothetical protein
MIEAKEIDGELWIKASDHHQSVKKAIEHEREACAKVCEETYTGEEACSDWPTPEMCASAIRARGQA